MNETEIPVTASPAADPPSGFVPARTPDELRCYAGCKANAYFDGRWRKCIAPSCRRRGTCTGGRRGTFLRTGKPLCWRPSDEAQADEAQAPAPAPRQPGNLATGEVSRARVAELKARLKAMLERELAKR